VKDKHATKFTVLMQCILQLRKKGVKGKGKAFPLQACNGPKGSRKLRFPDFMTTAQDGGKIVSPYAPAAFTPPGNTPGTHFC